MMMDDLSLPFWLMRRTMGSCTARGGSVDALPVGVVADAEDLRLVGLLMSSVKSSPLMTQYSSGEMRRERGILAEAI